MSRAPGLELERDRGVDLAGLKPCRQGTASNRPPSMRHYRDGLPFRHNTSAQLEPVWSSDASAWQGMPSIASHTAHLFSGPFFFKLPAKDSCLFTLSQWDVTLSQWHGDTNQEPKGVTMRLWSSKENSLERWFCWDCSQRRRGQRVEMSNR